MSQSTQKSSTKLTRRTMLAGTAAGVAATGMNISFLGAASAKTTVTAAKTQSVNAVCIAHHNELAAHLKTVLNSNYVEESMKNKILSTSRCPHCKTVIAPDMMNQLAFSVLS